MSESDDENLPSADECQKRCESFAEITGTDTACAQFYLQDRDWDLETSVNAFFEDHSNKGALRVNDRNESEVVVILDGSTQGLAAAATAVLAETALSRRQSRSLECSTRSGRSSDVEGAFTTASEIDPLEPYKELKFITWNIDGLNEKNLMLRTKAVYKRILTEHADIVFVQEVVPESAAYFLKRLVDYTCIFSNEDGYFVGTFLKKTTVKFESSEIVQFPSTRMMRNVLKVNAVRGSVPLCLFNSHLESTVEGATERKLQLRSVLKDMLSAPDDRTVIFAGDMNLRDKEVAEIGDLPAGIEDVWKMCGSRKECAYTWDLTRNDNCVFNGRFRPRCRFDRVYLRGSSPAKLSPKFFGLIGLERLLPHRCFPSDHWGILCYFEIE